MYLRLGESGLDERAIDSSYVVNLDENVAISPLSTQHPITQLSLPGSSHTSHVPKVAASFHSKCCPQDSLALSSTRALLTHSVPLAMPEAELAQHY